MNFNTKLLHGKSVQPYSDGATLPAIAQVSAFAYESAEQHEKVFTHKAMGYAYTRIGNPTVAAFEQRVCELEGGSSALACSSGMAAVTLALINILTAGDEIITSSGLYGGTLDLFKDLEKFGIKTHFVNPLTKENASKVINDRTRVIFGEVVSNPALNVLDIKSISEFAHEHNIPLIVDSTTATPAVINPIKLGADIVVHSSSKYINGGGNSISGIIVDSGRFKWDFDKFKALEDFSKYQNMAYMVRLRTDTWENFGSCLAPQNAYYNIIGMETLGLRMQRVNENADKLARALNEIDGITVNYLSLNSHPYHELYKTELNGNGGAILTIRVGSREKAYKVINNLKYVHIASNIGDIRTLAIHPQSTLYIHSDKAQQEAAGVYEDTIRISVGIEDAEDLIYDFTQAIEKANEES